MSGAAKAKKPIRTSSSIVKLSREPDDRLSVR
jgi:hypothetical protein